MRVGLFSSHITGACKEDYSSGHRTPGSPTTVTLHLYRTLFDQKRTSVRIKERGEGMKELGICRLKENGC